MIYSRKDFEKQMADREKMEDFERWKYRQHLDDKVDQQKETQRHFYKDVSKFQVLIFRKHTIFDMYSNYLYFCIFL